MKEMKYMNVNVNVNMKYETQATMEQTIKQRSHTCSLSSLIWIRWLFSPMLMMSPKVCQLFSLFKKSRFFDDHLVLN